MRAVVQRVSRAKVTIDGIINGEIGIGLMVLLAISEKDNQETIKWMCNKIANLRIFPDEEEKMNLSVQQINGSILLISNFTLYGDVQRGFRPGFTDSALPIIAEPLYNDFVKYWKENYSPKLETGVFGAMMDVEIVNSGPVTIIIDK
jgi:D-tyrosyl-tRNA(Tyr) deacylase